MDAEPETCRAHGWSEWEDPEADPPWICTQEKDHDGDHVATGTSASAVFHTWPRG